MVHLFAIIGLPGSGKSSARSVAESLNIPSISMGDVVRQQAVEALGETPSSGAVGEWATKLREWHGASVFATLTWMEIEARFPEEEVVVVEGVRSSTELEVFTERAGEVTVVYVAADADVRFERLLSRGREDEGEFSRDEFDERDQREKRWGVGQLLDEEVYDVVIRNESSLEAFESEVERAFRRLYASVSG